MSWILFGIACGVAYYYYKEAGEANKSTEFWKKSSQEWQEKFHEIVKDVTTKK